MISIYLSIHPSMIKSLAQEIYYYAGKPKEVEHTELTSDGMSLSGSVNPDEATLAELTQEGAALCAGALPQCDLAVAEGEKALWESLTNSAVAKSKPIKPRASPDAADELQPKTVKENLV
jgi:hypothetical protein